jgi:hypothetical protein
LLRQSDDWVYPTDSVVGQRTDDHWFSTSHDAYKDGRTNVMPPDDPDASPSQQRQWITAATTWNFASAEEKIAEMFVELLNEQNANSSARRFLSINIVNLHECDGTASVLNNTLYNFFLEGLNAPTFTMPGLPNHRTCLIAPDDALASHPQPSDPHGAIR